MQRLGKIASWRLDLSTGEYMASDAATALLGLVPPPAGAPPDLFSAAHDEDRSRVAAALQAAREGATLDIEFRIGGRGASAAWVHVRGELDRMTGAGAGILRGAVQDISGRKQAEEQLRRSEALLALAGQVARIGGWSIDTRHRELHWSPQVAAIHGVPPDATPDVEGAISFYVPEDRAAIQSAVEQCMVDGTPFDLSLQMLTATGRRLWVQAIGRAERASNGEIVQVSGAFIDISERVRSQQSLRELSDRLTTTLESISDGFFTLDLEWRFSFVNKRAGQMLSREPASLIGSKVWDEFPEAVGTSFERHYTEAMASQTSASFEEYFPPLDLWVEVVVYPSAQGLAVYFRDITAAKRAAAEHAALLESERAARQAAEAARIHFAALFEAMPGLSLVLEPENFSILAASDAYLQATHTRRENVLGQRLFDVFPDDPAEAEADGERNLRASLRRVKLLGQPDAMAVQRYPIPLPPELGGGYEERFASAVNSPVMGPDGTLLSIIHRVEDVTDYVRHRQRAASSGDDGAELPDGPLARMEADILQRSRELQRINEHLRVVQRVAHVGSWQVDLHGEGRGSWSEETSRIFGVDHGFFRPSFESFMDLVVEDDRPLVLAHLERARHGEPDLEFEFRVRRPDGQERHLHNSFEVVLNERGVPHMLFGTVQDVTARRIADLRVQAQLSRLELLHDITRAIGDRLEIDRTLRIVTDRLEQQLPLDFCLVALREPDGQRVRVASVGSASTELAVSLELDKGRVLSLSDSGLAQVLHGQLIHEPDLALHASGLQRRIAASGLRSAVLTALHVEGETLGMLVAARGAVDGFVPGEIDFLEQLAEHVALAMRQADLHGQLRSAYDNLRRSQQVVLQHERLRALGEMASGIAHDINNAIAPVTLYTESLLAKEAGLSPDGRRQLEIVQRGVEDVADTVARMRQFYSESDALATYAPVALNPLVRQAIELTEARWRAMPQREGVAIDVVESLQTDLPHIRASEPEIREALVNLIFNAVDAMPDGGTLMLRTCLAPEHSVDYAVLLEVADTGIGMNEETRRRSMEPFFSTKGERGTGLGLAMVYGIVQRHRGHIEIESAPGEGTTVRLRFQATHAAPEQDTASTRPADAPDQASAALRILLVDDEPAVLSSLRDILEMEGHQVDTADGGRAGIDRFVQARQALTPYDAVITDLGMPHVDGREVAASIKSASADTPVIMLTGWGRRMTDEGERPDHVDHLLAKPPRLDTLRAVLAQCRSGKAA